jgi:hypothetical protein
VAAGFLISAAVSGQHAEELARQLNGKPTACTKVAVCHCPPGNEACHSISICEDDWSTGTTSTTRATTLGRARRRQQLAERSSLSAARRAQLAKRSSPNAARRAQLAGRS